MRTTLEYLNEVVKKHAETITSDSALARFIGVTRQAIHQYKQGQNMNVRVALTVAKILEIDPLEPVAATLHAQAASAEEQDFWKAIYDACARR